MPIIASYKSWAQAYGVDLAHLARMLQRAGIEYKPGVTGNPGMLDAIDFIKAITFRSEKDEAIARQANAKAEEQEMINAERRKELMELAQIERIIWNDLLAPLRQEIEQMPKSLAAMCNPDDSETALKVLEQWTDRLKVNLQEEKK